MVEDQYKEGKGPKDIFLIWKTALFHVSLKHTGVNADCRQHYSMNVYSY